MDIKPIETKYNGYRFRSRLEARWAVFFDRPGIRYEYELEGFELPNRLSYLPDFYLPDLDVHAEVKPSAEPEHLGLQEIRKIHSFSVDLGRRLLLISGSPGDELLTLCDRRSLPSWHEMTCGESLDDDTLNLAFHASTCVGGAVTFAKTPLGIGWTLIYAAKDHQDLMQAEVKAGLLFARQARFEFGETPKGPRE